MATKENCAVQKNVNYTMIPPDGGWGWMIVLAYAIANIIVIPIMQSFGLIFKDKFTDMNMTATDVSIIINLNSAIGMALGLMNGALLKKFGYRKIGIAAGIFFSFGYFLTSWANSFIHFFFTYCILSSIGMGLSTSSFSLALNTYFKKRRNKAAGFAMTLTGLGPIFIPQIISIFLNNYGVHGCVLLLSAISTHIICAALLLQPIKWHSKKIFIEEQQQQQQRKNSLIIPMQTINESNTEIETSDEKINENLLNNNDKYNNMNLWELSSEDEEDYLEQSRGDISLDHVDIQSTYGFEATPQMFTGSENQQIIHRSNAGLKTEHKDRGQISRTTSFTSSQPIISSIALPKKRWFETGSLETVNLGSSVKIFDEEPRKTIFPAGAAQIFEEEKKILEKIKNSNNNLYHKQKSVTISDEMTTSQQQPETGYCRKTFKRIVKFFDLDLLKDKIYVNIMLGMSIAIFAEINFSLLTPFILYDLNYTTEQIASIMSSLAISDIIFRFISPFIGDYFKQTPRVMYMYSLLMLIITRTSLLFATNYVEMLIVGLGLGIAKGVRTVYMSLVIPHYVPLERLASASGIQMVTNGIFLLSLGPLLGVIRDKTGSYGSCIIFINFVTLTTLIMWITEMIYFRIKNRNKINNI